jgi:hypothetical protein
MRTRSSGWIGMSDLTWCQKKKKKEMTWCETIFCTKIDAKTSFGILLHFFGSFLHERFYALILAQPTQGF